MGKKLHYKMKTINILISILVALIPGISDLKATNVSGGIYANTNWTLANSPYIVTGTLTLFPGDTLTIDPGVVVKFNNAIGFEVRGVLIAMGTVTDSIRFTSSAATPTPGIWQQVYINNNLGGSAKFQYAVFEYASTALLDACCNSSGFLTIKHSRFYRNTTALGGYAGTLKMIVDSCYFSFNNYTVTQADKIISNCIFVNNNYGLFSTERIAVYKSNFCGNKIALYGGRENLQDNIIMNNGIGVKGFYEGFTNMKRNTIAKNDTGIVITGNTLDSNNIICSNYNYNLMNLTAGNLSAKNTCWCDTSSANISLKIYDGYDNASYGLINFSPFAACDTSVLPLLTNCSTPDITTLIATPVLSATSFSLYPNPTTGKITIQLNVGVQLQNELEICNVVGAVVYSRSLSQQVSTELDLTSFPKGIYFVKIHNRTKNQVEKMIIQ